MLRKLLYKVKPYSSQAVVFRTSGYPHNLYHFLIGHLFPLFKDLESNADKELRVQSFGELDSWLELIDKNKIIKLSNPSVILRDFANNNDRRPIGRYVDLPYLVKFRVHSYWDRFEYFDKRPLPEIASRIVELATSQEITSREAIYSEYLVLDRRNKKLPGQSSFTREIPNLDALVNGLEEFGSSSLVFGPEHDPSSMIRKVNAAKVLIGQTGAGLTHMLWLKPGSLVVEISLRPEKGFLIPAWKDCYAALAARLGHRYLRLEIQDSWNSPLESKAVARSIAKADKEIKGKYRFNFRKYRIHLNKERIRKFILGLRGLKS